MTYDTRHHHHMKQKCKSFIRCTFVLSAEMEEELGDRTMMAAAESGILEMRGIASYHPLVEDAPPLKPTDLFREASSQSPDHFARNPLASGNLDACP